jgi:transposase
VNRPRGTQRYRPTRPEDEDALTQAIIQLASQYGRYGYRGISALLKRTGWQVDKDRVERISTPTDEDLSAETPVWRREGLKVPQKQRPQQPRQVSLEAKPKPGNSSYQWLRKRGQIRSNPNANAASAP